MKLTDELTQMREEVNARAQEFGLDFFTTIFEVLDYAAMNEVAAYDGFPTRYPHWRFGMAYEEIQKSTKYKSGFALRFPRIIRIRMDKSTNEIAPLTEIKKLFGDQKK